MLTVKFCVCVPLNNIIPIVVSVTCWNLPRIGLENSPVAIQHWGSQNASRTPRVLRSLRRFVHASTRNGRRCALRGVLLLLLVCGVRIEIDVNGGDLAIVVLLSRPLQSVEADLGAPRLNDNVGILQLLRGRGLNFILGESGVVKTIVQSWVISVLNAIVRRAICGEDSIVPGGGGVIAVVANLRLPVATSPRQRSGV